MPALLLKISAIRSPGDHIEQERPRNRVPKLSNAEIMPDGRRDKVPPSGRVRTKGIGISIRTF